MSEIGIKDQCFGAEVEMVTPGLTCAGLPKLQECVRLGGGAGVFALSCAGSIAYS